MRAFLTCWLADLLTTIRFFFVPDVHEINPVTVFLYGLMGVPGVVVAGIIFAGVVVAVVRLSPTPLDEVVLIAATLSYGAFPLHNLSLLVWDVSLLGVYALGALAAILTLAFALLSSGIDPLPSDRRQR